MWCMMKGKYLNRELKKMYQDTKKDPSFQLFYNKKNKGCIHNDNFRNHLSHFYSIPLLYIFRHSAI